MQYKTALYLRLSKDDEGTGESSSISTQRSILKEYAKNKGLTVVREYVDDGFSGTNYNRPSFQKMIEDIESGKINCVITKDLSRLGRNSARTSDLLDEYFPSRGVRYISVIDGYDSVHLTNGVVMATPLVMAMHEMYARDISCKIKSAFKAKMERGDYIGSFAPYGYQKDTANGNKNHLVADPMVAHIVQKIFQMAADGVSPSAIARYLNSEQIATPAIYRCTTRPYLNPDDATQRKQWTASIICKMLRNTVYLGHLSQGKTSKVSFKNKTVQSIPREEWIIVSNTHEPLISQELFEKVRNRSIARRTFPVKGFTNIFSGIAKCADCGKNMTTAPSKKKGVSHNLCCGAYKLHGAKACSNHFIDYDLLYSIILQELQTWLKLSDADQEEIIKCAVWEAKKKQQHHSEMMEPIKKMEMRVQEISTLLKTLYEDYIFHRVEKNIYEKLYSDYSAELNSLEKSISELKKQAQSHEVTRESYKEFFSLLSTVTNITTITRPILHKLIDKIEVEQGDYQKDNDGKKVKRQKIKIYYRFIGNIGSEYTP